jgi:hypothetical protein
MSGKRRTARHLDDFGQPGCDYLTRGGAVILPIGLEGSLDTLLSGLRRSKANPDDDDHDLDEEIGELLDLPLIATE